MTSRNYIPKERLDVLSRRLERDVLHQHLRCLGLFTPAFFLLLFLSTSSSEPDAERVPVEHIPMHAFECLPCHLCATEPNKTESHTQTCTRTLWVRLRLQAGKGKVGQMTECLRKALWGGCEREILHKERLAVRDVYVGVIPRVWFFNGNG